jgi:hypothetical protein
MVFEFLPPLVLNSLYVVAKSSLLTLYIYVAPIAPIPTPMALERVMVDGMPAWKHAVVRYESTWRWGRQGAR